MTPLNGFTLFTTLPNEAKNYDLPLCQANLDHGFGNLVYLFLLATAEERKNGLAWFAQTYMDCVELSEVYGLPLDYVIDCVAVVSPQLAWAHNLYSAELIIRYFVSGSFVPSYTLYLSGQSKLLELGRQLDLPIDANVTSVNKVKALWILQGQRWALHGKKVEAFADNIRRFADSSRVTVDSHAISAWFGCLEAQSVICTPSFYAIIEADYKRLSIAFDVSPLEGQAIVWIVKRRLSGADKRHSKVKKVNR